MLGKSFWLYLITPGITRREQAVFPVGQHKGTNHSQQRGRYVFYGQQIVPTDYLLSAFTAVAAVVSVNSF